MNYSRRKFITTSIMAGASIPYIGFGLSKQNVNAHEDENRLKICIFSKHLQFLGYDALAETCKEAGLDGIDLTVRPGGHVLPEKVSEDLPKAAKAIKQAGLILPLMTTKLVDGDSPFADEILKIAHAHDIKYYRLGYYDYQEDITPIESLKKNKGRLEELARLNKKYSIHGAYQNHAGTRVGGPVWDLYHLLDGFDPNYVGCQYDIRHAVVEGGYSWPLGLNLLKSFIKTIVIKDFKWTKTPDKKWRAESVPLGEGMVDFKQYFRLLKTYGFNGPISLHFEYPLFKGDELSLEEKRQQAVKTIKNDVNVLREMLSDAYLA